jgi:NitT/TauT family transport system substrate-binding protein
MGRYLVCVMAVVSLLAVSGDANAARIRIVFPTTATSLFLPYYVAQAKGWLNGLEVDESYVTGDSNALRVVLSGNADFGAGIGVFAVLSSIEAGADIKAVSSWQARSDYNVVLRAGAGSTVGDLVGKTIATSGPGALPAQLPSMLMKKYRFDPSSSRFIQVGGHPARLQAVLGGRAEATMVNTITVLNALRDNKVTLVSKISKEFPQLGYVWNVVRTGVIDDPARRAGIGLLVTAGIRGSRFIMEHPDESAAILHGKVPDLPAGQMKDVIDDLNKDQVWGVDGGLNAQDIEFTVKTGIELGTAKKPVSPAQLMDSMFIEAAMKELGGAP